MTYLRFRALLAWWSVKYWLDDLGVPKEMR